MLLVSYLSQHRTTTFSSRAAQRKITSTRWRISGKAFPNNEFCRSCCWMALILVLALSLSLHQQEWVRKNSISQMEFAIVAHTHTQNRVGDNGSDKKCVVLMSCSNICWLRKETEQKFWKNFFFCLRSHSRHHFVQPSKCIKKRANEKKTFFHPSPARKLMPCCRWWWLREKL